MVAHRYILVNGEPQPVEDFMQWAMWFEHSDAERIVKQNYIPTRSKDEETFVSTVFLGIDYSFLSSGGKPRLYETMVFGGPLDGQCRRYCTKAEAEEGHHRMMLEAMQSEIDASQNQPTTL